MVLVVEVVVVVAVVGVVLVAVAHIATSEAFCNLYCVVVIINNTRAYIKCNQPRLNVYS